MKGCKFSVPSLELIKCHSVCCKCVNSFTATGNNNRLLQTAQIQMRRLNEPSHLDLCCLTFNLSTLHINVFLNDSLLR